jgi:hypothetical protein
VAGERRGGLSGGEKAVDGSLPSDPRDVDGLADVLLTLQDPKIVEKMSQVALDLAPRLDIKTHMLEVVEWLGI